MNQTEKMEYSDWLGAAASGQQPLCCSLYPDALILCRQTRVGRHYGRAYPRPRPLGVAGLCFSGPESFGSVVFCPAHDPHHPQMGFVAGVGSVRLRAFSRAVRVVIWKMVHVCRSMALVIAHLKNYRHCQECKTEAPN